VIGLRHCALLTLTLALAACGGRARVLRVCADPNNLPFSDSRGAGFENKIAELIASDRQAHVEYTWWAQRRGFFRNTLGAGSCSVVMGVPEGFDHARTTKPYYRSTYVFASRRDRELHLASLDDPRLRDLRIGVQMIGDDFSNSPPAHALSNRGLVQNVVGYSVFGNYAEPSPLSEIVTAVDHGDIDAALVWGPAAGFFAKRTRHPLTITPVSPRADGPLPFTYAISIGVRRNDESLARELDDVIARHRTDIAHILDAYGVPRVEGF